jgi:glutathione S-transferase
MLLHDYAAPSPRRVRIFLAEKGLEIPRKTVDLARYEQFDSTYRAKNPRCTVPMLELDDGTCLWDTLAICEYLEMLHPAPPLFGSSALERAKVIMWYERIEFEGFRSTADVMRNASPRFKDHALTGPGETAQIAELVERGRKRIDAFYAEINMRVEESTHVAGAFFSLADIQLLCVIDFATGWGRMPIPEDCRALTEWHARISARPSAKA